MPASPGSQRLWRVPRGALVQSPLGHRRQNLRLGVGSPRRRKGVAVKNGAARASKTNCQPSERWTGVAGVLLAAHEISKLSPSWSILDSARGFGAEKALRWRSRISENGHGFFLRRRLRQSPPVAECATVCVAPFLSILPHIRPFRNLPATPSVWLGGSGGRCALDAAFTIFDEHFQLTR